MTTPRTTIAFTLVLLLAVGCADHDDGADDPLASKGSHTSGDLETTSSTGDESSSSGGESSSSTGEIDGRPSSGVWAECARDIDPCNPGLECLEGWETENGHSITGTGYGTCVQVDCGSDEDCPWGPTGQEGVCLEPPEQYIRDRVCLLACEVDDDCPWDMDCIEIVEGNGILSCV